MFTLIYHNKQFNTPKPCTPYTAGKRSPEPTDTDWLQNAIHGHRQAADG